MVIVKHRRNRARRFTRTPPTTVNRVLRLNQHQNPHQDPLPIQHLRQHQSQHRNLLRDQLRSQHLNRRPTRRLINQSRVRRSARVRSASTCRCIRRVSVVTVARIVNRNQIHAPNLPMQCRCPSVQHHDRHRIQRRSPHLNQPPNQLRNPHHRPHPPLRHSRRQRRRRLATLTVRCTCCASSVPTRR